MLRSGLNEILLIGADLTLGNGLQQLTQRHGCTCAWWRRWGDLPAVADLADLAPPAVAIIDPGEEAAGWLAALRTLPGLWASTPVLGVGAAKTAGGLAVAGWIARPWQEAAALAAIEQWTGPLADHGLRDPEDAAYRLLRLVGMERVTAMLGRLADQLEEGLAALAPPVDMATLRPLAHRIAGIAGLHGLAELGRAWLAVDRGESPDLAAVAALTRAALTRVHKWPEGEFSGSL